MKRSHQTSPNACINIIGDAPPDMKRPLEERLWTSFPGWQPVFLSDAQSRGVSFLRRVFSWTAPDRFLFLDPRQYLNPNATKNGAHRHHEFLLMLLGRKCLEATLHNYSQEQAAHMGPYEEQSASWSLSRRRKQWHVHEECLWGVIRNALLDKAKPLLRLFYRFSHRLLFELCRLVISGRPFRVLSEKSQVRPFVGRYANRVGFMLNDFLVHTLLRQNETFIRRPSLEIGIANGESPTLLHGDRILDAGMEFLPFWPLWGKPRGNFKNFDDRILSADAGDLPFKDASFQTIIMIHVIGHCKRLHHTLQELHRALRPGGFLIVTMLTYDSWKYTYFIPTMLRHLGANRILGAVERYYRPSAHKAPADFQATATYHSKSREEWQEIFACHGFSVVKSLQYDANTYWITRLFFYGLLDPMVNLGFKFDLDLDVDRASVLYAELADRELENIKHRSDRGRSFFFMLTRNHSPEGDRCVEAPHPH